MISRRRCLLLTGRIYISKSTCRILIVSGLLLFMFHVALMISAYKDCQPFEPEIDTDFPAGTETEPIIPHILHQTSKTEHVKASYKGYIKSFTDTNPDWQYYFWTDDSARKLVLEKRPDFIPVWDSYEDPVNRADALRYVVLYEFGGVYADLDFECLRPLARVTSKYACIFSPEPFEMSVLTYNRHYFMSNAIMMCRPKHPFFKLMIDNLFLYQVLREKIDVAGPTFVTSNFLQYNNLQQHYNDFYKELKPQSNSPFFYKGALPEDHSEAVYVANSKYFFNTLDTYNYRVLRMFRDCFLFYSLNFNQKRACPELFKRYMSFRSKYAYAEHHWIHSYVTRISDIIWPHQEYMHIKDIVKHAQIY
ncbi:uncharacterized protein LOC132752723 [Ruditapes philippinarum]|uniref:uncharacterized protein LOC132752723 n=1 Tax=Ruditapes philippinarum TaxID=129788 RepID=UPI00295C2E4E|nr:uncharacterized protein LOC132752723 [Ruditapes philippinarum]